jgi:hypothetical protein
VLQPSRSTSSSTASAMSASQAARQELFSRLSIYWYGLSLHFRHETSSMPSRRKTRNKKTKALQLFLNGQIDVWGLRTPFLFLEWIGMNAMLVFVLGAQGILAAFVNGWYYGSPDNTLVSNVRLEVINFWRNIRTWFCSRFCSFCFCRSIGS